jgi:hypothetical protein
MGFSGRRSSMNYLGMHIGPVAAALLLAASAAQADVIVPTPMPWSRAK